MTIEFRCTGCGQLLKAPDEAAGRQAQCPKCDAAMPIPSDNAAAAPPAVGSTAGGGAADRPAPDASAPYVPTKLNVKAVLGQTVVLLKANLVGCVVAVLIAWLISGVLMIGISLGVGTLATMADFDGLNILLRLPLLACAAVWVKVGAIRYFITVARGEPASLKLLFSGGEGFTAFFSTGMVLGLLVSIGLAVFVIPGVILGAMLWPSVFLAVDRDLDLMRAFRAARMMTKGNVVSSLILFIIGYAIIGLSVLALGVGVIFGMAFSVLLFAVMYNTLVTGGSKAEG